MSLLTCFFLALIPYATSITFDYSNITPSNSQDIILSGADYIDTDDGIHLPYTRNSSWEGIAGRATYIKPLRLWNNSTHLASFSTRFMFEINLNHTFAYGHGITFFLAQNNSVMNAAGSIGLPFDSQNFTSLYPFVAVEFDTYGTNEWDPKDPYTNEFIGDHVGININSLKSVMSRKWVSGSTNRRECSVLINYNAESNILDVSLKSFEDNFLVWETGLSYMVDLRGVLPQSVIFGFSASTGDRYEKNVIKSWAFNSTEIKIKEYNGKNNKLPKIGLIIGGTFVLVIVMAILTYLIWRRNKKNGANTVEHESALEIHNDFEMRASVPRSFSYHELARSTANFAENNKLGEGGFGGVYKGFLEDLNMHVAVKRVSKTSKQGIKEYASEVKIISQLRHRNLVQLTGWCHERGELLLAYEFLENGSLDLHLFKGKSILTWKARYKIAKDLASALLYLHEECEQCVLHRDIKSSNVMLDSNCNAKLGDFGLAKLVDHEKGSKTTMLAGTLGYMAPECGVTGRATKESDVYSFGVVALEIASGRQPTNYKAQEEQMRLLEWVWELYGTDTLVEAIDASLGSDFDEEEIKRLLIVGLWCVHPNPELRPSIRQAIKVLNSETSLPLLPSKMPVASYLTEHVPALSNFISIGQYQSSGDSRGTAVSGGTKEDKLKATLKGN